MSRPLAKLVIKRATLPLLAQPAQFGALETLLERDPLAASTLRRSGTVRRLFALPRRICRGRVASRNDGTARQFGFCAMLPANCKAFRCRVLARSTAADGIGRTSPSMFLYLKSVSVRTVMSMAEHRTALSGRAMAHHCCSAQRSAALRALKARCHDCCVCHQGASI